MWYIYAVTKGGSVGKYNNIECSNWRRDILGLMITEI